MNLKAEFEKCGPWITRFVIDGVESGGTFDAFADNRVEQFFESFPNVHTILELGSLEGGHTFALAARQSVEHVVGIEARATNLARARFMQKLLRVENVEFVEADLESVDLASFGKFDAVFCSGLLYHLREPWKLMVQIARVAPGVFIWTHYAESADMMRHDWRGREHVEGGIDEPLSGMSPTSFWLTLDSLKAVLNSAGFDAVRILHDDPRHCNGPAVTIAASASSGRR